MKKETKKTEVKKVVAKKAIIKKEQVKVAPIKIAEEKYCCENSSKKSVFLPVALVLLLVIGGVLYYKYGSVATVNGKSISRIEYIKVLQKQDNKNVLNRMIQEELIKEEALKNKIEISQTDIDSNISTIEANLKAQGQNLEQALKDNLMTKADLEDQMRMKLMVEKLSTSNNEITQAQIDEFVTKNKASLPDDMSKEQLQTMIKEQLASQAKDEAINAWLEKVMDGAKIIYK